MLLMLDMCPSICIQRIYKNNHGEFTAIKFSIHFVQAYMRNGLGCNMYVISLLHIFIQFYQ
jgi:hypothetical protein